MRYKWLGPDPIFGPDGLVERNVPFVATEGWLAHKKQYVLANLLVPVSDEEETECQSTSTESPSKISSTESPESTPPKSARTPSRSRRRT